MKHILTALAIAAALALGACNSPVVAVDSNGNPVQLTREQQKQLEKMRDSVEAVDAFRAVDSCRFVLEGDRLIIPSVQTLSVSPSTNFLSLNGEKATIQIAPFNAGGPNGVGGITLSGSSYNFQRKTDSKGNVYLNFSVMGANLTATIDLTLYAGSNRASATINPTFNSRRVTLRGIIVPYDRSDVFRAPTTIFRP